MTRSFATSIQPALTLAGLALLAFGSLVYPLRADEPVEEPVGTTPASVPEALPIPASIVVQWWERSEIVEAIGLRPDQVDALNALWSQALEAQNAGRTEQKELFADFTKALQSNAAGDRAVLIDELAESAAAQARLPAELMDRGIAVLDPEQHGLILEEFPWIFRRSWMGHQTAREQQLKTMGGSLRIQPRRMNAGGEEHE